MDRWPPFFCAKACLSVARVLRNQKLLLWGYRALRVTCSTVAVVALLEQQWVAGSCFAIAWLLLLGMPRIFPVLESPPPDQAP